MIKPTHATTPQAYIETLDEPRKQEIQKLDTLIRQTLPSFTPYIQSGMLGYGQYHYKYASGREGDWARVALASQKNYISLYICAVEGEHYLPEQYKDRLPKASIGKSCIRFKRIDDVDLSVITEILRKVATLS